MSERKQRPKEDTVYIDEQDRLSIITRMKDKGIKNAALALACGVTPSAITLLLKNPIPKGGTRACRFMSKLQKALALSATAKRPTTTPIETQRRIDAVTKMLQDDPDLFENWIHTGELYAKRPKR
jgi:hypothetical protein